MAVYKLFPYKDTSLYSMYPSMNTGIDPINQASNLNFAVDNSPSVARILIAFDTNEITDTIDNKVTGSWDARLRSFIATAQGVVEDSYITVWPINKSWNQGTGTYLDQPITSDGACWNSPDFEDGTSWDISGTSGSYVISSYYDADYAPQGGGSWFVRKSVGGTTTRFQVTQSFGPRTEKDLNVDATTVVHEWYSGSMNNN